MMCNRSPNVLKKSDDTKANSEKVVMLEFRKEEMLTCNNVNTEWMLVVFLKFNSILGH